MRTLAPAVAALLVLAGCGSTTSVPASASPVIDPALRTVAAEAYTAAATKANNLKAALQAGPCTKSDNSSLAACASGLANAEQGYADDLAKISFPADARADADALLAIDRRVIAEERAFAAAPDQQADSAGIGAIQADDKLLARAVAALRRDLGLAPPPSIGPTPSP